MKITIIGAGNLASHLATGLFSESVNIVQIFSRDIENARGLARLVSTEAIDDLSNLNPEVDLVLIAVNDDAIPAVGTEIRKHLKLQMIAHTAGSISSLVPHNHGNYGVMWPLQSFSKEQPVNWGNIPILLTAHNAAALDILENAANLLSDAVQIIDDKQRLALHLAAAIANNFSNHMFALAEKVAREHGLDFDLLKPLIHETSAKVTKRSPESVQTGPAIRGDEDTMAKHRELLIENPETMHLYNTISESINRLKQH